jgi:hypothetical protein
VQTPQEYSEKQSWSIFVITILKVLQIKFTVFSDKELITHLLLTFFLSLSLSSETPSLL